MLALALTAAALVLLATSRHGAGLSAESADYIAAARSVMAGRGYRSYDGTAYTAGPLLYPTLLAAASCAFGIDAPAAARGLNAVVMGGLVCTAGVLFSRHLRSMWLILMATTAIAFSPVLLGAAAMVWPEPLFVLLVLLFVLATQRFLRRPRAATCGAMALLAALCLLQGHAATAVVIVGVVATAVAKTSRHRRRIYSLAFLAVACGPAAVWLLRLCWLTSSTAGRLPITSWDAFVWNRDIVVDLVTAWVVPASLPLLPRRTLVGAAVCATLGGLWFGQHRMPSDRDDSRARLWPPILWLLVHAAALFVFRPSVAWAKPIQETDLGAPYVLLVLFSFASIEYLGRLRASVTGRQRLARLATAGVCGLWLLYPVITVARGVRTNVTHGVDRYRNARWRNSPLVAELRRSERTDPIYSNAAEALYLLADLPAHLTPSQSRKLTSLAADAPEGARLVWFHGVARRELWDLEDLTTVSCLEPVERFRDGTIYAVRSGRERVFCGGPLDGVWVRTFTSAVHESAGTIESWSLGGDGALTSLWRLRTADGTLTEWEVTGPLRPSRPFEVRASGKARMPEQATTSPCVLHVRGTVDGAQASGTYRVEFDNPQWPGDRGTWQICPARPVHRFWADAPAKHVYTLQRARMKAIRRRRPEVWTYEGVAFHAFEPLRYPPEARPVHRFRSRILKKDLLTIDEAEKDALLVNEAAIWTYIDVPFHAYAEGARPPDSVPVYRFWSPIWRAHFYTASEPEKDRLLADLAAAWQYEGVAWYAPAVGDP
jgi:hypothetical protein